MAAPVEKREIAGQVKIFNKYTLMCAGYGLASSFVNNGLLRRPFLSGGHRHIAASVIGGVIGYFIGRFESRALAEKEFYIQDYVNRHPEDFTKEQPKKLSEITQRWLPVR
ncbi:NADH dehydrogenase [ubiquinone] 1 subunit C2-like [Lytechinus variegatus]|uniref:NADH dehydrogenase [ubiquinone] 1 subunit C2-like n=1 Tax=Lytechinus variegatus TaxID=7654 RepID=UPI001BB23EDC|nr:NADH dehydrogenase [ubiquinone] 1 subunit C2-like [Lytechinus variegatus]